MSRTKDDYTDHMNKGGYEECCRACPAKQPAVTDAVKVLTEAGYTVIPPVVDVVAR